MAKLADIALTNSLALSQTFSVVKQIGPDSQLRNSDSSIPVASRESISLNFRPEKSGAPMKATVRVISPPTAAEIATGEETGDVTIFINVVRTGKASVERVQHTVAYAKEILANAIVVDMIENAAQPY